MMNSMLAYPGRATLQVYQRLVQRNELAEGKIQGRDKLVDLADVRVPVMNVAGTGDVMVPVDVAHHVGELLPDSPEVRLETAPGGHLGALTGHSAPLRHWSWRLGWRHPPGRIRQRRSSSPISGTRTRSRRRSPGPLIAGLRRATRRAIGSREHPPRVCPSGLRSTTKSLPRPRSISSLGRTPSPS